VKSCNFPHRLLICFPNCFNSQYTYANKNRKRKRWQPCKSHLKTLHQANFSTICRNKLVDFVSPKKYAEVEHRLRQQLDKSKNYTEGHEAASRNFSLRNHPTGIDAFNKYQQAVERLRGMDHGKAAAVRKVMTQHAEIQGLSSITIATCRLRTLSG
jgi:hypothetical protein